VKATPINAVLLALFILLSGCDEDERVVRVATQAADRQAEQNQELVRLNREVAEGTRRLVEADAEARQELAQLQRGLQEEQAQIGQQRDRLEQERQQIALQRNRDPLVAEAISSVGITIACLLPLGVAALLIWRMRDATEEDAALSQLLVEELASDQPRLLPPPPPQTPEPSCLHLSGESPDADPPF
jgi:TolA-binding protein